MLAGLATLWSWRPVSCGVESFIRKPGVPLSCVLRTRSGPQDGSVLGTEDGVWRALRERRDEASGLSHYAAFRRSRPTLGVSGSRPRLGVLPGLPGGLP